MRPFLPTLKEAPPSPSGGAWPISLTLLLRGGYVRRTPQGTFDLLPLGLRVLRRIEGLAREAILASDAEEIATAPPSSHHARMMALAHELRSFRELPRAFFELRGVALHLTAFTADRPLAELRRDELIVMCMRLATLCGLSLRRAEDAAPDPADSRESLFTTSGNGEPFLSCACGYASTPDGAVGLGPPGAAPAPDAITKVHTPSQRSVSELAAFLGIAPTRILKSIVLMSAGAPLLAVVRGDHDVNLAQVARAAGREVTLATAEQVTAATGAPVGFAGPVGLRGRILVDRAAAQVTSAVVGANEADQHLMGVTFDRDFQGEVHDLRRANEGDGCPRCASGTLGTTRGMALGAITTTDPSRAASGHPVYTDASQARKPVAVTSLELGLFNVLSAVVDAHHDENGIIWPARIAPYDAHVLTIGDDAAVIAAVGTVRDALSALGLRVLVDDRDVRPGAKFGDADLVGAPYRVTIGQRSLAQGGVELRARTLKDPKETDLVPLADVAKRVFEGLNGSSPARRLD